MPEYFLTFSAGWECPHCGYDDYEVVDTDENMELRVCSYCLEVDDWYEIEEEAPDAAD